MTDARHGDFTILVTGATGKQGGAVLDHVLAHGFRARALTRDASKPAATALVGRGAEVAEGDLSDRRSVERALAGCDGVYSVQDFRAAGVDEESRQGAQLANVAREAGVRHLVYSSVGGADRDTGIPHFDSKWRVEEHIRATGVPHTILRPVFFMQNWESARAAVLEGVLPQPLSPTTALQQVSVDDVGAFAALAFAHPEAWQGRAFEIAGDELTMQETAETFARVAGREVRYEQVPWDSFRERMGDELTVMYRWFEEVGYDANLAAVRSEYPEVTTLERYLAAAGWGRAHSEQRSS